jgi:hypothetical protein
MKKDVDNYKTILFKSQEHEDFFYSALSQCRCNDVYHQVLCYCMGITSDTRANVKRIYNFKTGSINCDCLCEGWQTSGSRRILLLAFNLYTDGTPTVDSDNDIDNQICACREYSVSDIFCSGDAKYFWQAIKLRYPEYV